LSGDRLSPGHAEALSAQDPPHAPQVDLAFEVDADGRTLLRRQRAAYPFHVGRCWHVPGDPEGMLTLYVQSCSGGVFQRDVLGARLTAKPGAATHVTTSASTIVHTMEFGDAVQTVDIHADAGSLVEYLPDPLILFPRARLRNLVRVRAHPESSVMLWDAVVGHDPGGKSRWFDWLLSDLSICDADGRALARDRYRLKGEALRLSQPGAMHGYACQGSFLVLQRALPQQRMVEALRAALPSDRTVYAGATRLPADCGAWVRVLACDALGLREALKCAWYAARRALTGHEPAQRRK
jgi:urease accessory protein